MNWNFIILVDGKPIAFGLTMGEVVECVMDQPLDFADKINVWQVRHITANEPAQDATKRAATWWARKLSEATPAHLHPPAFHPFILFQIGDELAAHWCQQQTINQLVSDVACEWDMIKALEGETA